MSYRVTEKMLNQRIDYLNRLTNSPTEPWSHDESGKMKANIGHFYLSGAYGGVCLHRMMSDSGGVSTPLGQGHRPKRELFDQLCAFIDGIEFTKRWDQIEE